MAGKISRSNNAAALPIVIILALGWVLLTSPLSAAAQGSQVESGRSYTLSAPEPAPGQSYSYEWSMTDGSPQSSQERSFSWRAPQITAPRSVLADLIVSSGEGRCSNHSQRELMVLPPAEAKISIKKDCIFNSPAMVGDEIRYTYNVTNVGGQVLEDINLTDVHSWGPNCLPVYVSGDDEDQRLSPGESWYYECRFTIPDPGDYTKLYVMGRKSTAVRTTAIIRNLTSMMERLEIMMENMKAKRSQFDLQASAPSVLNASVEGRNVTMYNHSLKITGESLCQIVDEEGNLIRVIYTDPLSNDVYTVALDPDGRTLYEELHFMSQGSNENLKIEYENPSPGYRTVTATNFKTGDTLILVLDSSDNIISKEYKKTPGYRPYEERYYLKNTATVTARSAEGGEASASDSYMLEVFLPLPQLAISKVADPDPAAADGLLNYTIEYENNGGGDAHEVVVKETYNRSMSFLEAEPAPDPGTTDTWSLGDLGKGESGSIRIKMRVDRSAIPGSIITNRVQMSCKEEALAEAVINTTVGSLDLNITKSASTDIVVPDANMTYTIAYKNTGSGVQHDVVIHDYLDENVNFNSFSASPALKNDSSARHHWWYAGDLRPGEGGTIEIKVRVAPEEKLKSNAEVIYNNYRINSSELGVPNATLETLVVHSLWIKKSADKSAYQRGENVTYTVRYGNTGNTEKEPAHNVTITDILPEVEYLGSYPAPTFISGKNLTWSIKELEANSSRTIIILVHIPERQKTRYDESSLVQGEGYVYVNKKLSTEEKLKTLINNATISGYYNIYLNKASSKSTVTLIGAEGTMINTLEHGSGRYEERQKTALRLENYSISLEKDIFAKHRETTFSLPGQRSVRYDSLWSDLTSAENRVCSNAVSEEYRYVDTLSKNCSFQVDMNQTVYKSQGDFESGMAQISFEKHLDKSPKAEQWISENYHGSFKVMQAVDSYGESVKYTKSVTGKGFVASEKTRPGLQKSYEHGSGYYSSEELSQASSVSKSTKALFKPANLSAGSMRISQRSLWSEGMWTKEPEKCLLIGEDIRHASSIDKESEMDSSFLSVLGSFNGTMSLKLARGRSIDLQQVFAGSFRMNTAMSVSTVPSRNYPHLSIWKKALMMDEDTVLFTINVTNDGNKRLSPLNVTDHLPAGLSFINSNIRPEVRGQFISWTVPALDIGRVQTITLRTKIELGQPIFINEVTATGYYQELAVHASNATRFIAIYQPLPCRIEANQTIAATRLFNRTKLQGEWGGWRPTACFNLSTQGTDCLQDLDYYYDELDRNKDASCCASNYEIP